MFSLQKAQESWHNLNPVFLRAFDCLEAYAAKADLFRYLVVYREGGWYSDWKQVCLEDNLLDSLSSDGGNTTWFSAYDTFSRRNVPVQAICHQNAFFGATPRHAVLSNVIRRTLENIQSMHYGANAQQAAGGVGVLGAAVEEEGFSVDMTNTSRVGNYNWHRLPGSNAFRYQGRRIVQHKCSDCGSNNDWDSGNNYFEKWDKREYYCPDAAILFE
ncbi:MAG: hypothetical protein SGARI_003247 [Bacillariaceae sp.]